MPTADEYAPLAASDDHEGFEEEGAVAPVRVPMALSAADKRRLFGPLVVRYMVPLFCVYMVRSSFEFVECGGWGVLIGLCGCSSSILSIRVLRLR